MSYAHSHEDILRTFRKELKAAEELPEVLAHGMGNFMYLARLGTKEAMEQFFQYALETTKPESEEEASVSK